jgi:hypothetical protein
MPSNLFQLAALLIFLFGTFCKKQKPKRKGCLLQQVRDNAK